MNEAKITSDVMKRDYALKGATEVKITKTNTLRFRAFADHQIHFLLKVKHSRFCYKIRDEGISIKPFDLVCFDHDPAWCMCYFHLSETIYIIDIDKFYNEMRTSGKKSLTDETAALIAEKVIHM